MLSQMIWKFSYLLFGLALYCVSVNKEKMLVNMLSLPGRDTTRRAAGLCPFFALSQRMGEENTPRRSLLEPLPPDGFLRAVGAFVSAKLLPLGRMSARPRGDSRSKKPCFLRLPPVVAKRRETLSVGRELCGRAMARCPCLAGKQRSCVSAQAEMCRAAMPGRPRRERPGAQCLRPRLRDVRV